MSIKARCMLFSEDICSNAFCFSVHSIREWHTLTSVKCRQCIKMETIRLMLYWHVCCLLEGWMSAVAMWLYYHTVDQYQTYRYSQVLPSNKKGSRFHPHLHFCVIVSGESTTHLWRQHLPFSLWIFSVGGDKRNFGVFRTQGSCLMTANVVLFLKSEKWSKCGCFWV